MKHPAIEDIHEMQDRVAELEEQQDYILDCYRDLIHVHSRLLVETKGLKGIREHIAYHSQILGDDVVEDLKDTVNRAWDSDRVVRHILLEEKKRAA